MHFHQLNWLAILVAAILPARVPRPRLTSSTLKRNAPLCSGPKSPVLCPSTCCAYSGASTTMNVTIAPSSSDRTPTSTVAALGAM